MAGLHLAELRHPLLDRHLREVRQRPVPLTVALEGEDRVLVLSGPNAGGETVALKAVGLAVLAAQAELPVPAKEARLPVFAALRADIGDHQSIEADLSTFSAHVQAVARFLEEAHALPRPLRRDRHRDGAQRGAAIARAVLERLMRPGSPPSPPRTWGRSRPGRCPAGVASAAMEFDTERLRPTYRVLLGVAGFPPDSRSPSAWGSPRRC